jgi:hypothetical protein
MMNREDQAIMYNELVKFFDVNTKQDGSGEFISLPVNVYWGCEPVEHQLPCIILTFTSFSNPVESALGDIYGEQEEGLELGYVGEDILLIKIKSVDIESDEGVVSKQDIAQYLANSLTHMAIFNWSRKLKNSDVYGPPSGINDVSGLLGNEQIYELQFTVRFRNFVGGVPTETGILDLTAPFIQRAQVFIGILPNNNTIEVG